jgi:hypothetical protein
LEFGRLNGWVGSNCEARGDRNLFKPWIEEIEMVTEYFDERDFPKSEASEMLLSRFKLKHRHTWNIGDLFLFFLFIGLCCFNPEQAMDGHCMHGVRLEELFEDISTKIKSEY